MRIYGHSNKIVFRILPESVLSQYTQASEYTSNVDLAKHNM